jgi:hypothetical protein
MVCSSAWAFGWEALVAISTSFLALATACLAWLTREVATASQADVQAQWRPLLLPGDPRRLNWNASARRLLVPIRNAGRGPAIFVRTTLDPVGDSPENWSLGALAQGDEALLEFHVQLPMPALVQVLLDYNDLSDRLFSSAIVLDLQQGPRFYDVQPGTDRPATHHGPPVRPQPGLRDVTPPRPASFADRVRAAVRAFGEAHN